MKRTNDIPFTWTSLVILLLTIHKLVFSNVSHFFKQPAKIFGADGERLNRTEKPDVLSCTHTPLIAR